MLLRLSVAAACLLAGPVLAQEPDEEAEPYRPTPLFASDSVLHLTLTMDQRTVRRDIDSLERQEHPAVLSYTGPDGNLVELDIQVRTRGHFRRQRRNCNFPPIRLNIRTRRAEGTLFQDQDKIKLVTHCQNGRDEYEQYIILEGLVYKTFNLMTERSYRARPLVITYIDTENREDTLTRRGIILESDEEVLARTGSNLVEIQGVHPLDVDFEYMGLVDMFQFLVGNTDWSVSGLHNIVLMESNFAYYAVPYDFDWTGMVDARYARPDQGLQQRYRIRRVTDRLFRGFCRSPADFQRLFDAYNAKRDEIYALYNNAGLDEDTLEDTIEFIDEFFEIINDERKARREIIEGCRNS